MLTSSYKVLTGWGEGRKCQKSTFYPQMLLRCQVGGSDFFYLRLNHLNVSPPPSPSFETFHGEFFYCGDFSVFQKVTLSFICCIPSDIVQAKSQKLQINSVCVRNSELLFSVGTPMQNNTIISTNNHYFVMKL